MPRKPIKASQASNEPSSVAGLENIFQPERAAPWHLVLEAAQLHKGLAEAAATYRQTADPLEKEWTKKVEELEAFFQEFPQKLRPTKEHVHLCHSLVVFDRINFRDYSDICFWLSSQVKGYLPEVLSGNESSKREHVEVINQLLRTLSRTVLQKF